MAEFRSGHYLTFRIGRQDMAVDAAFVRAILPVHELVPFDAAEATSSESRPGWLLGEAKFQRRTFPVIDLRARLSLRYGTYGRNPSVVALELDGQLVGFFADRVSEIVHARAHDFSSGKLRIGRPRTILPPETLRSAAAELAVLGKY